jgi:cytosine/adenosine deaminase-related metal-dependent hydrolase
MGRKVIRRTWAVTLDDKLGDVRDADILIEDGRIAEIGPELDAGDAEELPGEGTIAIPGFVDTHRHTWQSLVRGVGCDWTLDDYFQGIRGMVGWHYRPEDVYAGNIAGALEALNAGVTALLDWSHIQNSPEHSDAAIAALRETRGRAVFAYGNSNRGWQPVSDEPHSRDAVRIRGEHFASDDDLVTMMLALRGPQWSTLNVTQHDFELARELDVRITVHVGDGLWGLRTQPILRLHERGLLGPDVTYVHCNSLLDEEYRLMADSGATASISAELEMHMGHGFPPTGKLREVGIEPSLSVDVVDSVPGDMFSTMRTTLAMERALVHQRHLDLGEMTPRGGITARDVLRFATIEGARACGLDDRIGSLSPGKQADVVLVSTDAWNMIPFNDPLGAVVSQAGIANVDTVLVAGEVVKRDGRLLHASLPRVRALAEASRDRLYEAVGVRVGEGWFSEVDSRFQAANR